MSENRNVLNQLNELNLIKNDNQILPERRRIISIIKLSQVVLFPDFYHYSDLSQEEAYIELSTEEDNYCGEQITFVER